MSNKKGMTLVELIVSIALISIVLVFLFALFINVKDINEESEINTTYLINKALIIKDIEEDFTNDNLSNITLSECSRDFAEKYGQNAEDVKVCIAFEYEYNDITSDTGYLAIYKYSGYGRYKENYLLSYIHGTTLATRVMTDFTDYDVESLKYEFNEKSQAFLLSIQIIGPDGKDYSLNIPYSGTFENNLG